MDGPRTAVSGWFRVSVWVTEAVGVSAPFPTAPMVPYRGNTGSSNATCARVGHCISGGLPSKHLEGAVVWAQWPMFLTPDAQHPLEVQELRGPGVGSVLGWREKLWPSTLEDLGYVAVVRNPRSSTPKRSWSILALRPMWRHRHFFWIGWFAAVPSDPIQSRWRWYWTRMIPAGLPWHLVRLT